jgi:hypothetical protein
MRTSPSGSWSESTGLTSCGVNMKGSPAQTVIAIYKSENALNQWPDPDCHPCASRTNDHAAHDSNAI